MPETTTAPRAKVPEASENAVERTQPWKGHWPPAKSQIKAPYGFKEGETIVIGGN